MRKRSWIPVLIFTAGLVAAGAAISFLPSPEPTLPTDGRPPLGPDRAVFNLSSGPSVPSGCGESVSLANVKRLASFRLLLPDHSLANRTSIRSVAWCPPNEVIMWFASGVRILQEKGGISGNPETVWTALAAEQPDVSRVGIVRGKVAWLVEPRTDDLGRVPGGVELVEGDLLVAVTGDGAIPLGDLVSVTQSLRPE